MKTKDFCYQTKSDSMPHICYKTKFFNLATITLINGY